jgi:fatty-acyl-CoA synthase
MPGSNLLFGLPLFHVGGALTQALSNFAAGNRLVVLSPADWRNPAAIKNVWHLVERFRPEILSSVPTVLAARLAIPQDDADVTSLRYVAGGGSAIPVSVGKMIEERLKIPVLEVNGMTETASVHTMAYPDRRVHLGSLTTASRGTVKRTRLGSWSWLDPASSVAISMTSTTLVCL